MTKQVWEQTPADMDKRFNSGGFQAAGGNIQSLNFAFSAMLHLLANDKICKALQPLSGWTSTALPDGGTRIDGMKSQIFDIGCAEGDGTAVLSYFFSMSDITGVDISPAAVKRAKARWPHLCFRVGDITKPDIETASIIFTSHTVEHQEHPDKVVLDLMSRCSMLIVVVPPVGHKHRGATHVGAVAVDEWLKKVPTPFYKTSYNTLRPNMEADNPDALMLEGNILMAWKGAK